MPGSGTTHGCAARVAADVSQGAHALLFRSGVLQVQGLSLLSLQFRRNTFCTETRRKKYLH